MHIKYCKSINRMQMPSSIIKERLNYLAKCNLESIILICIVSNRIT